MPVFNRLPLTQTMLACLRAQRTDEVVNIVVIDDGSTDGTAEYLAEQAGVTGIKGDGNLWWGGAIQRGLEHVFAVADTSDWVAFVNNDMEIAPDFLAELVSVAAQHAPSAVGSMIRDVDPPHEILSVGPKIDAWRILTWDALEEGRNAHLEPIKVDALSGRGTLYPVAALKAVGGMRPAMLPHYLADYDVSVRTRRAGWRLLVSPRAAAYSRAEYGSARPMRSWRERLFSVRSPSYLPAVVSFWWETGTWPQRLTLPFRAIGLFLFPRLRRSR